MKVHHWVISIVSALVLSACGGGGSDSSDAPPSSAPPASSPPVAGAPTGRIAGIVVASDTGLPMAGVQVQVAGTTSTTSTTAADGSFTQEAVGITDRQVVRFMRDGYADAFATTAVTQGETASVTGRMAPIAASATFDNSAGKTLIDTSSAASVTIPPSGVVDAASGAAPQGAITLRIAPINPATNPANMPGDYTTSTGGMIESFGALSVQLRDAAGKPLNLAPGTSATIRIPLASRSGLPQQMIPLFYFNELTGLWVEEGMATLAGVAPNQYYEGRVKRIAVWNSDKLVDAIIVNGCVSSTDGKLTGGVAVRGSGIDYSGLSLAISDAQGKFRLPIRRNARVSIGAAYPRISPTVIAGPAATDITLPTCLQLSPAQEVLAPALLISPASMTAPAGTPAFFYVQLVSDQTATFQWLRNGRVIDGATQSIYPLTAVSAADDQAQFSVRVTNSKGSVTSAPATLTVVAAASMSDLTALFATLFAPFDIADLVQVPLNLFASNGKWLNPASICMTGTAVGALNGQPIPVGTEQSDLNQVVSGTFDKCVTRDNTSIELSGFVSTSSTANADLSMLGAVRRADHLRRVTRMGNGQVSDVTGNGSDKLTVTRSSTNGLETIININAPVPGSTILNNLNGVLNQFIAGESVTSSTDVIAGKLAMESVEQRSVEFAIAGVRYVVDGKLTFPMVIDYQLPESQRLSLLKNAPPASGQLSVMRNGFQIGRIFAGPNGRIVEINGVVQPF
ncbi:MAG: hypothetical protein ACI8WM_000880 [Burkholderiaceae bacterium]|jgi:hypothetical protein